MQPFSPWVASAISAACIIGVFAILAAALRALGDMNADSALPNKI
jgi:hypothetical protein